MEHKCEESKGQFNTEFDDSPDDLWPCHFPECLICCLQVCPGEERQECGQCTVQEAGGESQWLQNSVTVIKRLGHTG